MMFTLFPLFAAEKPLGVWKQRQQNYPESRKQMLGAELFLFPNFKLRQYFFVFGNSCLKFPFLAEFYKKCLKECSPCADECWAVCVILSPLFFFSFSKDVSNSSLCCCCFHTRVEIKKNLVGKSNYTRNMSFSKTHCARLIWKLDTFPSFSFFHFPSRFHQTWTTSVLSFFLFLQSKRNFTKLNKQFSRHFHFSLNTQNRNQMPRKFCCFWLFLCVSYCSSFFHLSFIFFVLLCLRTSWTCFDVSETEKQY